ncbi:MAG: T9SS type A sorting domain-containing protein [Flavobacteriales bacterium]|nr:T9SS type A sorting domain-containing protein [Flavobacteriales bacterium]
MHSTIRPVLLAFALGAAATATSQCQPGEMEVTIDVITDDWGNETYWQLVAFGNGCDQSPLFIGGNSVITCATAGNQTSPNGGYPNNSTISEGPWCLIEGAQYSIIAIDSYGDAQASFNVYVNGASANQFSGTGGFNIWTFTVAEPAARDMGVIDLTTPLFNTVGVETAFSGTVKNFGGLPITDFTLNFSFDGTVQFTSDVSGVNVGSGQSYEFFIHGPWVPSAAGSFDFSVFATNINGLPDDVPDNDAASVALVVNEAIPDIIADYLVLSPVIVPVADDDEDLLVPRDLGFHPDRSRNEIWVINKDTENSGGSTVKFTDAGETSQSYLWQRDQNAWHFMSLPTAIAFGDNGNFSTTPGVFDANHNGGAPFTGITLWSSDPAIYALPIFGGLGSHLDMLHVTPHAQGICHERWNRYWVVDGYNHDVVMHDFRADHGPGNDYHGNAIIRRYAGMDIQRDPADHIVSHCVLDKGTGWLYVVDHGNARVIRLNTTTGTVSGPGSFGPYESYVEYSQMSGHVWEDVVTTGLVQPAGIELVGNHLLVSDHANGDIKVYDIAQPGFPLLGTIATGAPGIMGIAVGYDGRIWYVNATTNSLVRIDPDQNVGIVEAAATGVQAYPNPTNDRIFLSNTAALDGSLPVSIFDATGRIALSSNVGLARTGIDASQLAPGAYTIIIGNTAAQRVTIAR